MYRMTLSRKRQEVFLLNTPQEIILNSFYYSDKDIITYIERDTDKDFMTITVEKFKFNILQAFGSRTYEETELGYLNLLLVNYDRKNSVIDRGRFLHIDQEFNKLVYQENRHLVQFYVAYQNRKVVVYVKLRSQSLIVGRSVILKLLLDHRPDSFFITIPEVPLTNHQRFHRSLRLDLGSKLGLTIRTFSEPEELPKTNLKRLCFVVEDAVRLLIKQLNQL